MKLETLKKKYDDFYASLYAKGKTPVRDTAKGIWGAAAFDNMCIFFDQIEIKGKKILDLGSGDGKVVLIASLYGAEATGIEFDAELVTISKKIQEDIKATFIEGDFFEHDFSSYDIFFINPDQNFQKLEKKLIEEMKDDSVLYVYNNIFLPNFMKRGKAYWVGQIPIITFTK